MIMAGIPTGNVIDIHSIEVGSSVGVDLKSVVDVSAGITTIDRPVDPPILVFIKAGRISCLIFRGAVLPQVRRHRAAVVVAAIVVAFAVGGIGPAV